MEAISGLESLLRLRKGFERAARLELRRIHSEIIRAKAELERIDAERHELQVQLAGTLKRGFSAAEFAMYSVVSFEMQEQAVKKQLMKLEELRGQAERKYEECRRERKVMENMIERRRREYEKEAGHREQRAADDATLRRRSRVGRA
jgi:flagellar export protein FliJ